MAKTGSQPDIKLPDELMIPEHIAFIMDGNRRWAKKRNLPSSAGHKAGEKAFHKIVEKCRELGIKVLTAYAFSAENWKRSAEEVGVLMHLFEFYLKEERKYLIANGIKLQVIGDKNGLPPSLKKSFERTEKDTEHFTDMTLNLAVNYGSRNEITQAAKKIAIEVLQGRIEPESINEEIFSDFLMTSGQKDPELLIRTSGEMRLSNFLLWQSAYTEFFFTETLWPDFTPELLMELLMQYGQRNRRFGGN